MLSKSELKELKSLHRKKYREAKGSFLVEGDKSVREALLSNTTVKMVYAVETWTGKEICSSQGTGCIHITENQLNQICELKNPKEVVALCETPASTSRPLDLKKKWHIYLDRLQDPGNMGTILRIADWYGMDRILCSPDCVELFNQKVIQASMGAIFRVETQVIEASVLIEQALRNSVKLYASSMSGESIYDCQAETEGVLLIGNEGSGLDVALLEAADRTISIPGAGRAESLNAAVATGILSDWINRSSKSVL